MTVSKQQEREFAAGWDELYEAQRYQRAKYLVEHGIDEGMTVADVVRATERTSHPLSHTSVGDYIDLYHTAAGAGVESRLSTGPRRLRHAMSQYDVEPKEVAERAAELQDEHGYSEGVAQRAARAEIIGEALAEEGLITEDGKLKIADPRTATPRDGQIRMPQQRSASWDWNKAFERGWGDVLEFLVFLRRTKQDEMRDKVIPRRLRKMAEDFDKQSDRFEVGVDKYAARKAAGATR